ncbi:hypothetical protein [Nonomuraea endophytica]|uniref:Restriction system protein Mrr-like N-terminal domain-containing protein n=1 Tax=Nonomuraea endophytica TaxID=714136 RepID=A0A7W8AFK2_9ACTN|nr:hypothetical protein [Nonomuraea endophytica]MBB5085282.1 hypothetical protein [Nonomuraea endophytica]
MSDGHATAAQREALRLICHHDRLTTAELAGQLVAARPASTHPGYAPAIARQAGMLAWRLQAQHHITETGGLWTSTASGRDLIGCSGGPA